MTRATLLIDAQGDELGRKALAFAIAPPGELEEGETSD
jgi:hypothetical protein